MTSFPLAPRLLKFGLVILDPQTAAVLRVIPLQYNPDTLTRTLQAQTIVEGTGGNRAEPTRLVGPPVETFKLDAELDATDALEQPDQNQRAVQSGIHAELAALETLIYPPTAQLQATNALAQAGTLEIAPIEAPLVLFVWSAKRIVPVRITELTITEDAFDPHLNPIRAKVSLGFRILNINDLGFNNKGGSLYLMYQQQKERLAAAARSAGVSTLGIGGIP
jgi:hypothetical protein